MKAWWFVDTLGLRHPKKLQLIVSAKRRISYCLVEVSDFKKRKYFSFVFAERLKFDKHSFISFLYLVKLSFLLPSREAGR